MNMRDTLGKIYFHVSRILGIRFLYESCIKPKSITEDARRKEFILNVILVMTLTILMILGISLIISFITFKEIFSGISLFLFLGIFLFFGLLLFISRKGALVLSSWMLIFTYLLLTLYCVYEWSFVSPMIILGAILTITVSSILFSTRFSFLITTVLVFCVGTITYLQIHHIFPVDLYWQTDDLSLQGVIEIASILFCISGISWLSNRETEKSLLRAQASEQALLIERDLLEVKVEERTQEIKNLQAEHYEQLSHLAEIGSLSTGVFHDLMTPLTSIIHLVDKFSETESVTPLKSYVMKALAASKKMGDQIALVRRHIKPSTLNTVFNPIREIQDAIDILSYKARVANVSCVFHTHESIELYGNSLFFHQVSLNLISNAIDAYDTHPNGVVTISLTRNNTSLLLTVHDNGNGIPYEYSENIFDEFFTTKNSKGLGIGLSHIRKIIEKDFKGAIKVSSNNQGTLFSIVFPIT